MKTLVKPAVVLACVLAAGLAGAADIKTGDYHWGSLDGDQFTQRVDGSSFYTFVHFTLKAGSIYDLVFDLSPTDTTTWNEKSSFSFELLSGDWNRKSDLDDAVVIASKSGFADDWGVNDLAAGDYTLHIYGKGDTGKSAYHVTGRASIPAAAPVATVAEPETCAMLLAGLGLMGLVARRRKPGQPA